ncbi:substrate-binding domain-containing protein [Polymorphobacter multimanifer]|uniref:Phosphate transport system substrate-binding protein n=1 Tax=Polymorphobacter multimanifer TaxID=1070431 RepID=A0A841L624_9SPHN|nr:substrate-binding domain-containing protein [Polymorphobacter multimanifer]MBB6228057.1 phosphate transport system substrate-binding protein [Polymorphobacter multimanifer]
MLAVLLPAPVAARSQLRIVGSSTLYPFVTAVAEQFKRTNPQFPGPIVESTGTGGGIKLFCSGVGERFPDVANASRRIKATEVADCRSNGVTDIIEVQIGLDGLALAQGRAGRFPGMTEADIYRALAANPYGRKQTARLWSDVNPSFPAIRIEVLGPPPTSGTRDAFNELYMEKGCDANPAMKVLKKSDPDRHQQVCTALREDGAYVEAGENDNLIVQKLAANPRLLGVFGFSYLEENLDKVKGVPISGVPVTYDNIASFAFPASRPLYVYVKGQHMRAVRGMREFLVELSRESTWGPKGYLSRRGLVASPVPARSANAAAARTPVFLDPSDVL